MLRSIFLSLFIVVSFSIIIIASTENSDNPFFKECLKETEGKQFNININEKETCVVVREVRCSKSGKTYKGAYMYSKCGNMNESTRRRGTAVFKEICPDALEKFGNVCAELNGK